MIRRLSLPLLALGLALSGCGSGESEPSGSESIAGSMKGLKSGPYESRDGVAKTDKATNKPAGN